MEQTFDFIDAIRKKSFQKSHICCPLTFDPNPNPKPYPSFETLISNPNSSLKP